MLAVTENKAVYTNTANAPIKSTEKHLANKKQINDGCFRFLDNIHHLFAHIVRHNINDIDDMRQPFSRSNSTASLSSAESTQALPASPTSSIVSFSSEKADLQVPRKLYRNIEVTDIRCAINEGKNNQTIIAETLQQQGFSSDEIATLTEKTLLAYKQAKISVAMQAIPGAVQFIHALQRHKIDFCFCSNAGIAKIKTQLHKTFNEKFRKTFNEEFIVYGKAHKGDRNKCADTASLIANQYAGKLLIVIGNEMNDFQFTQTLQELGYNAWAIIVGEHAKRPITTANIVEDSPVLSFNAHDYVKGFQAAEALINHYGANNCAIIMDVHGTVLDTAALLKKVMINTLSQ